MLVFYFDLLIFDCLFRKRRNHAFEVEESYGQIDFFILYSFSFRFSFAFVWEVEKMATSSSISFWSGCVRSRDTFLHSVKSSIQNNVSVASSFILSSFLKKPAFVFTRQAALSVAAFVPPPITLSQRNECRPQQNESYAGTARVSKEQAANGLIYRSKPRHREGLFLPDTRVKRRRPSKRATRPDRVRPA